LNFVKGRRQPDERGIRLPAAFGVQILRLHQGAELGTGARQRQAHAGHHIGQLLGGLGRAFSVGVEGLVIRRCALHKGLGTAEGIQQRAGRVTAHQGGLQQSLVERVEHLVDRDQAVGQPCQRLACGFACPNERVGIGLGQAVGKARQGAHDGLLLLFGIQAHQADGHALSDSVHRVRVQVQDAGVHLGGRRYLLQRIVQEHV